MERCQGARDPQQGRRQENYTRETKRI
jgi:hypothetical protein